MRVLVCGGRTFGYLQEQEAFIYTVLDSFKDQITHVISGGAAGADDIAIRWAARNSIPRTVFMADWKKYGRGAGSIRNQQMLDEGRPEMLIAFPGGKGTTDMIRRAKSANIGIGIYSL